jgi:hypothetical protein
MNVNSIVSAIRMIPFVISLPYGYALTQEPLIIEHDPMG